MFLTLSIARESGRIVFIDPENKVCSECPEGVPVKVDRHNPFRHAPAMLSNSADVLELPEKMRLNHQSLTGVLTGPQEKFRAEIKLNDSTKKLTVALWIELREGALKRHEFLVGGKTLNVCFPLKMLGGHDGLEGGSPDIIISGKIKTSAIRINPGSHVSEWTRIEEMFKGSISSPGLSVNWPDSAPIYVRWSVQANDKSSEVKELNLVLEAMPCGVMEFEKLSNEAKAILKSGAAKTFFLWSAGAMWYRPALEWGMCTTPGVYVKDETLVTDPLLRYALAFALDRSRRGAYTEAKDWPEYFAAPYKVPDRTPVPIGFVFPNPANCEEKSISRFVRLSPIN